MLSFFFVSQFSVPVNLFTYLYMESLNCLLQIRITIFKCLSLVIITQYTNESSHHIYLKHIQTLSAEYSKIKIFHLYKTIKCRYLLS
jgi:hypothetical protein